MGTLTDKECKKLVELGQKIRFSLDCDINGSGLPCATHRLTSLERMTEYLQIHNFEIIDSRKLEQG